tara:strand:+ start:282 stop:437 length:156 start_codon:yes stop_codon:yes gene_type:complete
MKPFLKIVEIGFFVTNLPLQGLCGRFKKPSKTAQFFVFLNIFGHLAATNAT